MPRYILNLFFTIFLVIYFSPNVIGQEKEFIIPDSLQNKSYKYLLLQARKNYKDTILSVKYLNTFLKKATLKNDTIRKIISLNYLSAYETDNNKKLDLIERIASESKHLNNKNLLPVFVNMGGVYYDNYLNEIALSHYIKALRISEKHNIPHYEYIILNNIAKVKERIGAHKEALAIYKRCFVYESNRKIKDTIGNIVSIINLAESFRNNKKYDSASYYYHNIIDLAKRKSLFHENILTVNEGINLYYKKQYLKSEKLLSKGEFIINSPQRESTDYIQYYLLSQLYLGKIQLSQYGDEENAKKYFKNIIFHVTESNILLPSIKEAFEFQITYYKKRKDYKNQLDITNKLLQFNATISSKKLSTVTKLHSEFDTPELLKNKEVLIKKLKKKTSFLSAQAYYLVILISILLFLFIIQYNKRKKQKKDFETIILKLNTSQTKINTSANVTIRKKLDIDENIISSVLEKLILFEKEKEFLHSDINITSLAKKCNTNTKYLSKIINKHKSKSFSNYINDLKIDYILNELNDNSILRRYTIKSISEEAGFNTSESFASAFKKKTGIKPSYFIRNLEKQATN
ncbi:helix-turn-helix domain-containing protein [uncultured Dokdonia sp.]|uniref:helix-turn-helix domain-containing protein n=1 Tax=uncultured Dokdonia sp. TaxID=575653 RepID=UPI00262F209A|nr:helix-turn-helix domain-containing protein [uncultured Dokdonia sp.]